MGHAFYPAPLALIKHDMKKLLFLILIIVSGSQLFSQVTLEGTYTSAASSGKHFLYIQLDSADYKYVVMDPINSQFTLYNLNHSVYLNVTIPLTYDANIGKYSISYITKSLIDCDSSNIEYILSFTGDGIPTSYPKKTIIYRTDGTLIQTIDSALYLNYTDGWKYGPEYNKPVTNTQNGTKLFLRHLNGDAMVYSMCGHLHVNIQEGDNATLLMPPYPNPTMDYINLPYKLPEDENQGEIEILDVSGKVINSFIVDKTFDELLFSTENLPAGIYYYCLKTENKTIAGSKIIKIK